MNLVLTIIQVVCGLILIAVVMLQSGKSAGLSGDSKLAKMTKWVALLFVVLTLAVSLI